MVFLIFIYITLFQLPLSAMNAKAKKSSNSHPSMSHKIERAVQVHPLTLDNYQREDVYTEVDHSIDCSNPLLDTNDSYCRILA